MKLDQTTPDLDRPLRRHIIAHSDGTHVGIIAQINLRTKGDDHFFFSAKRLGELAGQLATMLTAKAGDKAIAGNLAVIQGLHADVEKAAKGDAGVKVKTYRPAPLPQTIEPPPLAY